MSCGLFNLPIASDRLTAFGRSFCLAAPELTRSGGIKLNE
jgi:hypothetical protein